MVYNNKSKDIDYSIKYANWNKFYDNLELEIRAIREVGNNLLFDLDSKNMLLNKYFSLIVNLFSSHRSYVIRSKTIQKTLDKIEETLFSPNYLKSINKQHNNIRPIRIKIIKALRKVFADMCESFSLMGLRPKIEEVNLIKYSDTIDDPEEKEYVKDLEKIGII